MKMMIVPVLDTAPASHRVDDHDVDRAAAYERFGDFERLLAVVRLGHQQRIDVYADLFRIHGIERVLGVDERRLAAHFLRLGDHVQRKRRFTGGLGSVNFNDPAAGQTADTGRRIQRDRTGGDRLHVHAAVIAQTHDRTVAEILFDLGKRRVERLLFVGFFLFDFFCVVRHVFSSVSVQMFVLRVLYRIFTANASLN